MLHISLNTDNEAFENNCPQETARILREFADKIENGLGSGLERGRLLDINGNYVGDWDWTP